MKIDFSDFAKVDMRIGKILNVEMNEKARKPAFRIWVDLGPELGIMKSSAQFTEIYSPGDLTGKLVVCVVNFAPKIIAGFASEVLILGAENEEGAVVILQLERDVPPGERVF